ncbi:hypothetical protein GH5_02741 [Leishmania sp. Ghana 2012 LV757]|uniref:hypothetical protein n=1 Tax=Leishmania sp. Ghana 2012 LV757 TaxID=2803181 RepID=UPI001B5C56AA|nr:hypothetical protein GH5_02741 [Leishmania sp. Ghana 2012 LV757]
MTALSETISVIVPSFATVTLVPAPGLSAEGAFESPESPSAALGCKTLRVPITSAMTVRELAKGAMMRYMLSLRRAAKAQDDVVRHLCRTGIAVTDVYLLLSSDAARPTVVAADERGNGGGTGEPPVRKIELLSDDCVVQVVQVMKETVHMRFCAANAAAATKSATSSKRAAAAAGAQSIDDDRTTEADVLTATRGEETSNSMSINAPPAAVAVGGAAFEGPGVSCREGAVENAVASTSVAGAAQESSRTPVVARQHSETAAHNTDGTEDSSWEEEKETEEQQNISLSIATLREREAQRIRWGPEAHKHFAANYVSSPEKIMVGRFKCGRRPPPVVRLHSTQASSSASSMGSIGDIQSPRSLKDSIGVAETGHGRLSPRPVGATKTGSGEEQHGHQRCEEQRVLQPPRKRHHGDDRFFSRSTSSSIERTSEVLISPATTEPRRFRVATAPAVSTSVKVYAAAEEVTARRQSVSPNRKGQGALLCSAVTPVDVAVRAGTPPLVPSTVAKPVVAVVARQLSFEEDGDIAFKRSRAMLDPSAAPPACSVYRAIRE